MRASEVEEYSAVRLNGKLGIFHRFALPHLHGNNAHGNVTFRNGVMEDVMAWTELEFVRRPRDIVMDWLTC